MKITINEPCHENWDAMTPNAKGAFCKSCAKDVVDFSKMGLQQIKNFFAEKQSGKICGRFEEKQLQELSVDDFVSRFRYWNFTKRFAAIFFITFGLALFSSQTGMAQGKAMVNGGVSYVPNKTPKNDTAQKQQEPKHPENYIQGGIKSINIPKKDTTKKQTTKTQQYQKMGKVKCVNPNANSKSTIKGEPKMLMGDVAAPPKDEPMIMGEMVMPPKQKTTPPKKKDN